MATEDLAKRSNNISKTSKKTKRVKRITNASIARYIPEDIAKLGIGQDFLMHALAAYMVFRKEPEALMRRQLRNPWNIHRYKSAMIAIGKVEHLHSWDLDSYCVLYDFIETKGDATAEWWPYVKVRLLEYAMDDAARCELHIWNSSETFTYDFDKNEWTVRSTHNLTWVLPKNPLPPGVPLTKQEHTGVEFGSFMDYRLRMPF